MVKFTGGGYIYILSRQQLLGSDQVIAQRLSRVEKSHRLWMELDFDSSHKLLRRNPFCFWPSTVEILATRQKLGVTDSFHIVNVDSKKCCS